MHSMFETEGPKIMKTTDILDRKVDLSTGC